MESRPDFYDIIGVNKDATPEQIKKQYRKLSLELHPDRPNGDRSKWGQKKCKGFISKNRSF